MAQDDEQPRNFILRWKTRNLHTGESKPMTKEKASLWKRYLDEKFPEQETEMEEKDA